MNLRLFPFLFLCSSHLTLASLPDEDTTREVALKSTSVDQKAGWPTKYTPNRAGIQEILTALNITEPLESTPAAVGGFGEVYFTKSYAIKITLSTDYSTETRNLRNLKTSQKSTPVAGFRLSLPRVICTPYFESGTYYKTRTSTQHVYIAERLRPAKAMESVARDALSTGSQEDLDLGYSFGYRLAEFQAKNLTKAWWDDYYSAAAHIDLNLRNIFPMSRPEHGTPGAVALIDCAEVLDGSYSTKRKPISVDMIYFLMKLQAFLPTFSGYKALSPSVQKQRMDGFIHHVFLGYFAGHAQDKRASIRDFYLSDLSYTEARNKTMYSFPGDLFTYRTFHTAINAAFQTFLLPPQYPVLPRDFDAERYIALQGFENLPDVKGKDPSQRQAWAANHFRDFGRSEGRHYIILPRGFNADGYLNNNPDLLSLAKFYVTRGHQHLWLMGHYLTFGKNEGRNYFDGLPSGFNPAVYLHLNKDVVSAAQRQGVLTQGDLHSFAYEHYCFNGRAEGRAYLTELPEGFDPLKYLDANPDLLREAQKTCKTEGLLKSYAYDHYHRHGREEGRPCLAPAPKGFIPDDYLALNPDVKNFALSQGLTAAGQQRTYAHTHYYLSGRSEGRPYLTCLPAGFLIANYLHLNQDVVKAAIQNGDTTQGKMHSFGYDHYYTCGYDEGRPYLVDLPPGFDALTYINANPDLIRLSRSRASGSGKLKSFAYDHYYRHGREEGRPYLAPAPDGFSPDNYLALNPDLREDASKQGLTTIGHQRTYAHNHYFLSGRDEGRPYLATLPHGFLVANYLDLNPDIVNAAIQNGDSTQGKMASFGYNHYYTCGYDEGRPYLVDLPDDFDPLIYLDSNPDVLSIAKTKCRSPGQLMSFGYDHYNRVGRALKLSYLGVLPEDFEALLYYHYNKDAFALALQEGNATPEAIEEYAGKHYLRHRKRDYRRYK
ncbi:MAG: hypothetical protein ACK5TR_04370 [Alphaproteobacteria bacterium]|jgi:hypothetical protein|nr:hypothetical protein [Alphaproteobacteria bacterium]